jgi:DedD protein
MMSVRYTGQATMEGPALRDMERDMERDVERDIGRDIERWKDKIEVRLDNRQVFFLFFGSALVACMLFVLGVLVGKRIESRGRAEAPTIDDPLAVLDRFRTQSAAGADDALTFPGKLIVGAGGGASRFKAGTISRDDRLTMRQNRLAARPVLTAATPVTANAPDSAINPAAVPARSISSSTSSAKMQSARSPAPPSAARTIPVTGAAAPAGGETEPTPSVAPEKPATVPDGTARSPAGVSATRPISLSSPSENDRPKGHFLLQLSAFKDKGEAEAFARQFAGKSAYVVATELPGTGVWYRVRLGNFATLKEATSAKATFEREHNVIAYVAGSGPSK